MQRLTWSLTGGGGLQESNYREPLPRIYFMEDNLLRAMSKLQHV